MLLYITEREYLVKVKCVITQNLFYKKANEGNIGIIHYKEKLRILKSSNQIHIILLMVCMFSKLALYPLY